MSFVYNILRNYLHQRCDEEQSTMTSLNYFLLINWSLLVVYISYTKFIEYSRVFDSNSTECVSRRESDPGYSSGGEVNYDNYPSLYKQSINGNSQEESKTEKQGGITIACSTPISKSIYVGTVFQHIDNNNNVDTSTDAAEKMGNKVLADLDEEFVEENVRDYINLRFR